MFVYVDYAGLLTIIDMRESGGFQHTKYRFGCTAKPNQNETNGWNKIVETKSFENVGIVMI